MTSIAYFSDSNAFIYGITATELIKIDAVAKTETKVSFVPDRRRNLSSPDTALKVTAMTKPFKGIILLGDDKIQFFDENVVFVKKFSFTVLAFVFEETSSLLFVYVADKIKGKI